MSDSGTLPEESSFFASVGRPFPAVCIRTSTERPEAPVPDYADETVSTKVVKIIQSYTGVVDKMVWRKSL